MLATFLLGLGLGSIFYDKLRRLLTDPAVAAIAQLGIFFTIVISAFQWDGLSGYFASFGFMQDITTLALVHASLFAAMSAPSS